MQRLLCVFYFIRYGCAKVYSFVSVRPYTGNLIRVLLVLNALSGHRRSRSVYSIIINVKNLINISLFKIKVKLSEKLINILKTFRFNFRTISFVVSILKPSLDYCRNFRDISFIIEIIFNNFRKN